MEIKELIISAFEALSLNKTRTALATLGIVIGIGAVIALLSLGKSSQQSVESSIQSLGSNLLTISPSFSNANSRAGVGNAAATLTLDDAKAIQTSPELKGIKNVSAELSRRTTISAGRNNASTQITGVLPAYAAIHNISLDTGRFIISSDDATQAKVVVLGPQVITSLFGEGINPVGQSIRINKIGFQVVGTTKSKGGSGPGGNQDDAIYIPLSTAQKQVFGAANIGSISIEVASSDQMDAVRNDVGYFLLSRHKISDPTNADFSIFSQADILGAVNQVTGTFTALLSGIAAISLLVGGIGIMNIMLVTVVERTREIGLRKSLGATKRVVTTQFLVEAIILTVSGGVLGMLLGITLSFVIAKAISLPFVIDFQSIILAIGVSGGIGILFGYYPARKAANLSPIEALRYE